MSDHIEHPCTRCGSLLYYKDGLCGACFKANPPCQECHKQPCTCPPSEEDLETILWQGAASSMVIAEKSPGLWKTWIAYSKKAIPWGSTTDTYISVRFAGFVAGWEAAREFCNHDRPSHEE